MKRPRVEPLDRDASEVADAPEVQEEYPGAIKEVQSQVDGVLGELSAEFEEVRLKHRKRLVPLFKKRAEEITKNFPDIWHNVLPMFQANGQEMKLIKHLTKVHLDEHLDEGAQDNFLLTVTIEFSENPFMTNTVLKRTYGKPSDPVKIEWKAGDLLAESINPIFDFFIDEKPDAYTWGTILEIAWDNPFQYLTEEINSVNSDEEEDTSDDDDDEEEEEEESDDDDE